MLSLNKMAVVIKQKTKHKRYIVETERSTFLNRINVGWDRKYKMQSVEGKDMNKLSTSCFKNKRI